MPTPYPLAAVRAVALHTQGLASKASPSPVTRDAIYDTIDRIGCLQIDTLQMIHRSHYLALWSRLGAYDPADLDALAYDPESRRLFEYWLHAACYIPLTAYRYVTPLMRWYADGGENSWEKWLAKDGNAGMVKAVLKRIKREGGLRAADFEHRRKQRGDWWDWKPAKRALEYFYDCGDLMIANRVNFQRVYDLKERVLPEWVDTQASTFEEANRYWVERSIRALGVCQPMHAADYTHAFMKRSHARPAVEGLLEDGALVEIEATLADGEAHALVAHRDNLPLLEQAADGALPPRRTTFLSPFDSLFWAGGRDEGVWDFRQVLEAYKPADQREWGYFCLPILRHARLVGRFDPKLERKTGTLRLRALYLEPGVKPDEGLVSDVAAAMRDFMAFHAAAELVIEKSRPATFGKQLLKAL